MRRKPSADRVLTPAPASWRAGGAARRRLLGVLLRVAISLALLAVVLWLVDWRKSAAVLAHARPGWALAAVLLSLCDRAVLNLKWQVLLDALGVSVRYWRLLKIQFAANLVGTVFPSSLGVDAFRSLALFRTGFGKARVLAATLIDRLTIVAAAVLMGIIATLHSSLQLPPTVFYLVYGVAGAGVLASLLFAVPTIRKRVGRTAQRLMPVSWHALLTEAWNHGTTRLLDSRVVVSTILTVAVAMAIRVLVGVCLARACGYLATPGEMALAYPIIWIATMLPITVGGLGLQEAAYVIAMGIIGIAPDIAVAMSVSEHVLMRLGLLPGALFIGSLGGVRDARAMPTSTGQGV